MESVTLLRRQKWVLDKWLPTFLKDLTESNKNDQLNPDKLVKKSLSHHIKEKILFDVHNMTREELDSIPGIFRMRFHLTSSNLVPPNIPNVEPNIDPIDKPKIHKYNNPYNYHPIQRGHRLGDNLYEDTDLTNAQNYEDELLKAINESSSLYDIDDDPELTEALMLSQIEIIESKENEVCDINNDIIFSVCIDLRLYGPNPETPIYMGDMKFYLDKEQIKRVKECWMKVNPETTTGINTNQNIQYFKSMALDIN